MFRKIILMLIALVMPVDLCSMLLCERVDGIDVTQSPLKYTKFVEGLKLEVENLVKISALTPEEPCHRLKEVFNLCRLPAITPVDYLMQKIKYLDIPIAVYVLAFIYIEKINEKIPGILDAITCYKIILTALVIAAKYYMDGFDKFCKFAVSGGIKSLELIAAEMAFLDGIENDLGVTPDAFAAKLTAICKLGDRV